MKLINTDKLKSLIDNSGGQFFSIVFVKKDGSDRYMTCRTGVSKGTTGVGLKFDPAAHGLRVVYDTKVKQHRMINIETVKSIQINKETFTVCD